MLALGTMPNLLFEAAPALCAITKKLPALSTVSPA